MTYDGSLSAPPMKRARPAENDREPPPPPAKRPRLECAPRKSRWCDECMRARAMARTSTELLTVESAQLMLQLIRAERSCPNQLTAYAVTSLHLARSPPSEDEEEEVVVEKPTSPAPTKKVIAIMSKTNKDAESESDSPPTQELVESDFLIWDRGIDDADSNPDETETERTRFEDAFDAKYGHLCVIPRERKRAARRLMWPLRGFQGRDVHPNEARVRMDAPTHTYFIDGDAKGTISMSTLIHGMFEPFDAVGVSESLFKTSRGKYAQYASADAIRAAWDVNRDNGSARHAAMECAARCERDRVFRLGKSDLVAEPPPGFYDFLARYPFLVFVRCELSLFDEASRVCGQADALMRDTRDGGLWVVDWKNTTAIRKTAFFGKKGTHPLTQHLPSCNYAEYTLQVNGYRHMIETTLGWPIVKMILVNFDPARAKDPTSVATVYEIAHVDMAPFFRTRTDKCAAPVH